MNARNALETDGSTLFSVRCPYQGGHYTLRYRQWGAADNPEVLVCVHGLTRNGADFIPLAQALSHNFRVICPDLLGRGQSDWAKPLFAPALYAYPQYVADMRVLLQQINATRINWLGTSMGGLIGLFLAASPLNNIKRLILNDIGPWISAAALNDIRTVVAQPTEFTQRESAESALRQRCAAFDIPDDAGWQQLFTHSLVTTEKGWRLHFDPQIVQQIPLAHQALDLWLYYQQIHCPTLVVRGALSNCLSADTWQQMAHRGPAAQRLLCRHAGHAPALMRPAQIDCIAQYLAGSWDQSPRDQWHEVD